MDTPPTPATPPTPPTSPSASALSDEVLAHYEAARTSSVGRFGRKPKFTEAVNLARKRERARRAATARSRVLATFRELHPTLYAAVYRHALEEVYEERGPLPGDEPPHTPGLDHLEGGAR